MPKNKSKLSETEYDWRYLQGYTLSPILQNGYPGLSLGFIRWVKLYSALLKENIGGWKEIQRGFPAFQNLFRKNDI